MLTREAEPHNIESQEPCRPGNVHLLHRTGSHLTPKPEYQTDDEKNDEYPDGGFQAWTVVLGAWCAMIPSMGLLNTLSVLQAWVAEHQLHGVPESKIGWIFSCYGFFLYFCGAQVGKFVPVPLIIRRVANQQKGPIFDAHDVRVLIVPGSVGIVACTIFLSFAKEYYQILLSFGVLGGISASLLFNPSIAAIGHWFHRRRALATGLACTAGGLGGIVFPLVILYLAPRIGFPWAMRIISCINAAVCGIACIFLRKRLPPNKTAGASIDFKALRDTKFATTTLAIFLIEFAVFIPYSFISSYAVHSGFDSSKAYMLNALLNVGAIPGRCLPGYVADRFGTFNTMCVTALTCALFILTLWLTAAGDEVRTTAFTILFGFWSGAAISLTPVCVSQVCSIEDYGKRNGTAFFIASFGTLVGIPIAGAILEANGGDYWGLIVFAGAFYIASCIAFVVARRLAVGWKLKVF